ncbi:MAG: hypothetical protein EZS26_000561 [Candidatus Ordinivivax streblomastigis]|uniref:Uncharacterized protein n=1 Tax=Candidatus Ordinivivax streblomastigis TaxID=2540710 RepID=A0A5M8P4S8_9BACT|nr:MAG: hypothetical protein EZS26_000406 [Candidatus Ordinivivax streblomastigis]KAA6303401.1 MAG: hypothetical protein EZS26_000561 [Candidatus Ordinivivax streblomastigis]
MKENNRPANVKLVRLNDADNETRIMYFDLMATA